MLDRKLAPPFQKTLSLSLPRPVEVRLPSGIKLFLVPGIQQNVAKIEVVFSAGKWFEPKTGLSHFTSLLLEKGTTNKTAAEIASTLDYYGASLEIHSGFDFVSVSLFSLKSKWENVFQLFLEIIGSPSFPEGEWNLAREIFLQNLRINNEKVSYRASTQIRKNVFGESHPYGPPIEEKEVQSLSVSDFHDFFKKSFKLHSLYVVGEFTDDEVQKMQEGFRSFAVAEASLSPAVVPLGTSFAERIEKKGSLQSAIRFGKRSPLKTDPDYFDLQICNHLLGGFFGSRLMRNIREEKGLTYSIHSSLNTFAKDGLFLIGADVNKVNLDLAIREIKSELRQLRTTEVEDQELVLAKNHFVGSIQADMANLFSVSDKIKNIQMHGLSPDYYQDLFHRVDQVGPADILRVAEKYFHEDSMFEVAVG